MANELDSLIIYVHGAFASKNSWGYVQKNVSRLAKRKSTYVDACFEYDLQEDDAFLILSRLIGFIEKLIVTGAPKKIILVGHSFGGVLCVAAARKLPTITEAEVSTITLSAPFNGMKIASLITMFTPSSTFFANISHNSKFMWSFKNQRLASQTHSFVTTKGKVRWIAGENDGVVTLESQLHFKLDPLMTIDIIGLNHFEILLSDSVASRISLETIPKLD